MDGAEAPNTYSNITSTFTSFLTVTLHTLLHARSLYPSTSFLTARAYNFPVAQSRHPAVCRWIDDAVSAVQTQMLRPNDKTDDIGSWVERIVFVIFNEKSEVMERWVFDVSRWLKIPRQEVDTEIVREATGKPTAWVPPEKTEVDLAEQLRATLSQISSLSGKLAPLPKNCTFSLAIEVSDEGDPPLGHPQPWIPVQPALQRRVEESEQGMSDSGKANSSVGNDLGGAKTLPVRKVDAGEVVFELWVEEGKAKLHASIPLLSESAED